MKTSTLRCAALASTLGLSTLAATPALASAGAPAVATQIVVKILDKVLGVAVGTAIDKALIGREERGAVDLSQSAYDEIAGIVGAAISTNNFEAAAARATDAMNGARGYYQRVASGTMTAEMAFNQTTDAVRGIIDKAGLAETELERPSVGLRGVPLYGMVQATTMLALEERTRLEGVENEPANRAEMERVGQRTRRHLDKMQREFERIARDANPLYSVWSTADGVGTVVRYCFDGPAWHTCGSTSTIDPTNPHILHPDVAVRNQYLETLPAYFEAFRLRAEQLALVHGNIFGDIGEVRHGIAAKAFHADRFMNPRQEAFDLGISANYVDNFLTRRLVGDVDGDGRDDIVGFGLGGGRVLLGDGVGFTHAPSFDWNDGAFTVDWGYFGDSRKLADVDADGDADIVAFGIDGVYVSLSDGQRFQAPRRWFAGCEINADADPETVRALGDFDGDGRADLICIYRDATRVALSDGRNFLPYWSAGSEMTYDNGGWRVASHPRMVADVNGDGRVDLVGFGDTRAFVALSDGDRFVMRSTNDISMTVNNGGWQVGAHPRMLADVNGDGLADAVGFGDNQVFAALADGKGGFDALTPWVDGYGFGNGWRSTLDLRTLADVDGDGDADLVTARVGTDDVTVSFAARP